MKPMGTITKYYPFMDGESKSILDAIMAESSNYYDFAQRLGHHVLENEVPINLAYIAVVQVWWCRLEEVKGLIRERYKNLPHIKPWGYPHASIESDQAQYHDTVARAVDEAIDTSIDDWIKTELHLLHAFYHWPVHGDVPSLVEPLEKAKDLMKANPALVCFEPLVQHFEGVIKQREGDMKGAIQDFERGQKIAETYDDVLYKYVNMLGRAGVPLGFNVQEALALYEDLNGLTQDLEVPYFIYEVLNDSAIAFEAAGEYDLAIACYHENVKADSQEFVSSPMLLRIYCTLGKGELALEWADRSLNCPGNLRYSILYSRKAWALALLGRLEEAEHNLDLARSLVMKSGSERELGYYYLASGTIEFKSGDFPSAIDLFKQVLEISERTLNPIIRNLALLGLAGVEIAVASKSKAGTHDVTPGEWLSQLERYAVECDLPGIRMQAALLKSELYQKHGQLRDAHAILVDALDITDSLGVKTLRNRISVRIQELERLMLDEELVS
ncbi:MAG: tetratricopeptide repeat protein [Candidatus Thorarchaeota archaeon]